MRTRYDVMRASSVTNEKGVKYPDVLTYPKEKLVLNHPLIEVSVTYRMKDRFYLLCYHTYGTSQFDDIVLWFNHIDSVHNLVVGQILYLPDKRDILSFLSKNRVRRKDK